MELRGDIGRYGHDNNCLKLVGTGWNYKDIESSRNGIGGRVGIKSSLLKAYYFNICLENTNTKNYITEKIWEAIFHGCVPVYYGNESIYEIFDKDSL